VSIQYEGSGRTVCEAHGACADDLQHLEHLLRARVKPLSVSVQLLQPRVTVNVGVDVVAQPAQRNIPATVCRTFSRKGLGTFYISLVMKCSRNHSITGVGPHVRHTAELMQST
jgi:hypothetical protein